MIWRLLANWFISSASFFNFSLHRCFTLFFIFFSISLYSFDLLATLDLLQRAKFNSLSSFQISRVLFAVFRGSDIDAERFRTSIMRSDLWSTVSPSCVMGIWFSTFWTNSLCVLVSSNALISPCCSLGVLVLHRARLVYGVSRFVTNNLWSLSKSKLSSTAQLVTYCCTNVSVRT